MRRLRLLPDEWWLPELPTFRAQSRLCHFPLGAPARPVL